MKFKQVRHGARASVGEIEFLKNMRKSHDFCNTPLIEGKFSEQLRSFRELFLRETKVDNGTNLLSAPQLLCYSQENHFIVSLSVYAFRTLAHSFIQ